MKHYLNFICNALSGNLKGADIYYRQHKDLIQSSAQKVASHFPVSLEPIYRGVLLEPELTNTGILVADTYRQFLSFSAKRSIAEVFADKEHDMAFMIRIHCPNCQGFLIEHTPTCEEILFHYSWSEPLGLERYLGTEIHVVKKQQEVMLVQHHRSFKLLPVEPGISRKHDYRM